VRMTVPLRNGRIERVKDDEKDLTEVGERRSRDKRESRERVESGARGRIGV